MIYMKSLKGNAIVSGCFKLAFIAFLMTGLWTSTTASNPDYYEWTQNNWNSSANPAAQGSHPGSQTGWTNYFSKDTPLGIDTSSGKVKLATLPYTITNTTPTDFNSTEFQNIEKVSDGNGALRLLPTINDPFANNELRKWRALPSTPYFNANTRFTRMGDYIYSIFVSGDGKQFGRIKVSDISDPAILPKWQFLTSLPVPLGAGAAITNDGQYIFVLRGGGSNAAYFYLPPEGTNPGTNPFTTADNPITLPVAGSEDPVLAWPKFSSLSEGAQKGSSVIHVGTIADRFAKVADRGQLYAVSGGNRTGFFYYDTFNKEWRRFTNPSRAAVNVGATLIHRGGDSVYLVFGDGYNGRIDRFSRSSGTWSNASSNTFFPKDPNLISFPTLWEGSVCSYPGSGDYVYAAFCYYTYMQPYRSGANHTLRGFFRFGPLSDPNPTWQRLDDAPAWIETTASIIYDPGAGTGAEGNKLHLFSGRNYTRPWVYKTDNPDPSQNHWETMSMPLTYTTNSSMVYVKADTYTGNKDYMYMVVRNTWFLRYDVAANKWDLLAYLPETAGDHPGNRLTYLNGYIYYLAGNNSADPLDGYKSGFYRYRVSQTLNGSDSWDPKTVLPQFPRVDLNTSDAIFNNVNAGSGIIGISQGGRNFIYGIRSSSSSYFYAMEIGADNAPVGGWITMPSTRDKYNNLTTFNTTNLVYPGYPEDGGQHTYIYAITYFNTVSVRSGYCIYKYGPIEHDTDTDPSTAAQWTELSATYPHDVTTGHNMSIAYPGTGQYLYTTTGTSDTSLGRYNMPTGEWTKLDTVVPVAYEYYSHAVGGNNSVYLTTYYSQNSFYRYDVTSGRWDDLPMDQGGFYFEAGNAVKDSNNNVYFVGGRSGDNISSHLWIYSTSLKKWVGLMRAPFHLSRGTKAEYLSGKDNSINSIYVTEGRQSNRFCKYNITNDAWSFCKPIKTAVTTGSQITTDGISKIYFVAGGDAIGKTVWIYNALQDDGQADPWGEFRESLKLPFASTVTADLMEYAQGNLYLVAQNSNTFYKYQVDGQLSGWDSTSLRPVGDSGSGSTIVPSGGICLYYPGAGSKLYCIPRDGFSDFLSYDIGTDLWSPLKEMPWIPSAGVSAIIDAGESWVYTYNSAWRDILIRYDKTDNIWDAIPSMPAALKGNSALCAYKGYVYILNGGAGDGSFSRYNTEGEVWEQLQSPYSANSSFTFPNQGIFALPVENPYDGKAYIYFTEGYGLSRFFRYSINDNTWQTVTAPPGGTTWKYGNSMTQVGNYLYIVDGNGTNFWKYRLDDFYDMSFSVPLPESVGRGASVAYSSYDGRVYFFSGARFSYFYKWLPGATGWTPLASCPVSVNDSQSNLLYPGFGKYLYYIQGSSYGYSDPSSVFLRYSMDPTTPASDRWTELTPSSFGIYVPGTLLYAGGQNFYVAKGYDSVFLSKYSAFCFGDYVSKPIEVGRHCKWGTISWDSIGSGSVGVSARTGSKLLNANLTDALDWGQVTSVGNGQNLSDPSRPLSSIKDTDKYIQYRVDFSTDETGVGVIMPRLDEIRINWEKYASEKTLVSSPYNTGWDKNRLRKLMWNNAGALMNPTGSEIRFQLRTSANGSAWSDWLGPLGTRMSTYALSDDSLYVRSGDIKQLNASDSCASLYYELENFNFWQDVAISNNGPSSIAAGQVALIDINSSATHFWNNVASSGQDIRFFDGTNKMSYFLAKFDNQSDIAQIAVKLNSAIAPGATMHVYMFYGNARAFSESNDIIRNLTAIKTDPSISNIGWWDCDQRMVASSAYYTPDSSGMGTRLYMRKNIVVKSGEGVSGGNAFYMDGASGYMTTYRVSSSFSYKGLDRTFSLWIKPEVDPSGSCLLSSYPINGYNYRIQLNSAREMTIYISNSTPGTAFKDFSVKANAKIPADSSWHNIVWVLKGKNGAITGAVNNGAGKVRYTTSSPHSLTPFTPISVFAMGEPTYNTLQTITSVPDATHFDTAIDYVANADVTGTYCAGGTTSLYLDGTLVGGPFTHYITDWSYVDTSFPSGTNYIFGSYTDYDNSDRSWLYKGYVDNLSFYNYAFDETLAKCMYAGANRNLATVFSGGYTDNTGANLKNTGKFYTTNPTIEPIYGVFYNYGDGDTLASFVQDPSVNALGTSIKYQVSPDGYNWYWWDSTAPAGGAWVIASGGTSQANVYTEINANLSTFRNINLPTGVSAASGDFYWRAYLMSTDGGTSNPQLRNVTINVTNGASSYYTDPAGLKNINIENENCVADRWIQYKAILYSDGENTPTLNDVVLRYIEPYITIGSPSGGETWVAATTENITWTSHGLEATKAAPATHGVQLKYSIDNGVSWVSPAITNDAPNSNTLPWNIPFDPSPQARVSIASSDYPVITATSPGSFRILGIILNLPNGGEIWERGSLHSIEYRTSGYGSPSTKLKLQLSNDGGLSYNTTLAQEQTDAPPWQIPWRINQSASDNIKLRIYDANPVFCTPSIRIVDESNSLFSIVEPPKIIIDRVMKVPEEEVIDGKMIAGKRYRIEWHTTSQHFAENFILEYSKDNFATPGISIGTAASGVSGGVFPAPASQLQCNYVWLVIPYDIADIKLKIREDPATVPSQRDTPAPQEATIALSIIEPYFTIVRPNAGEIFVSGDKEKITWTTTGSVTGPFKLEYCTDYNEVDPGASSWMTIETNTAYPYLPGSIPPDVREYIWPVPIVTQDKENCRIRITDISTNTITDMSDVSFKIISHEKIAITTPDGGEEWVMGVPYNITWGANGQSVLSKQSPVYVYLYYSTDDGKTYNEIPEIGPQVAWKESCEWTPELPVSTTKAKIKIEALDLNAHPYLVDASEGVFSIKDPSISRIWLEHDGTEVASAYATGNYDIRWESYGAVSNNIKIEYRLNGAAWQTLTASTTTQEGSARLKPWEIPKSDGALLEFKMTDNNRASVVKISDVFSITKPVINITAPAADFPWVVGLSGTVSWTTQGGDFQAIKRLKVQCIADATHTYDIGEITTGLEANAGSFDWTLPANAPLSTAVNKATIKIFDPDPSGSGVTATLQFNIKEPSLIVDVPTQADSWRIGSQNKTISWHRLGMVTYPIHIYCRTQDGAEHLLADIGDTNVSASWNWTSVDFPGIIPGTSYIVIRDSTVPVPIVTKFDTERNGLFTIEAPRIKILGPGDPKKIDNSTDNPNYGQQWTTTDSRGVEWECDGMMDGPLFKVEWSRSVGETVAASGTIAEGINSESRLALWSDIPQEAVGPNVRLKITNTGSAYGTFAQSAPFTVFPVPEFLTLTALDPVTDASTNTVRIGNTYKVKWTRNVAAFSNALELSFALTGSPAMSDWRPITETPVARDLEYYTWTIPHTDMMPYAGAKLRIYDTASWKSSSAAHTEKIVSVDIGRPVFNNIKLLKPGSAQAVNCIALAEVADIRWGWDGYISEDNNSVSIKLIEDLNDNGKIDINEYSAQIGTSSNTGSYNGWIVPVNAPATNKARIVLQDIFANYGLGNEVIDASEKFTIINQPEITLVTPNGGQDYIIGTDKISFEWTSRGISVDEVKIELSSDDFNPASTPYLVTDAAHPDGKFPNTGELRDWLIQQDSAAGSHVKARISMVGRESEIFDVSNNSFRIRSGFIVKTPALNEKWATNEIKDITWDTKGAIQKVSLFYSIDNGMNFNPIPGAKNIDNTGSFSWRVPNERTDINVTKAQIMVKDAGDTEGIIQNKSEPFDIIWYKIKFYIIDKDTYSPIGNLIVRSKDDTALYYPGWNVPIDLVSAQENDYLSSPISYEFPAGTFVVTWSTRPDASGKSPYFDRGVEVKSNVENSRKGILVELESVISAQIEWHVILTNSYVAQSDTLSATAWIERRGKLQEPIPMDTSEPPDGIPDTLDKSNFKSCELKVYDYDTDTNTPLKVFTDVLPDDKGLYKFVWNPTGLQEGKTYFVRATITYGVSSTPYTSGGTFDISVTKAQSQMITEHAEQKTLLETITGQAAVIQTAVTTTIPQKIDEATSIIGSKIDTSTNAIKTETSAIKAETAKILTATESTIPTQIRETVEPSLRSEILNRESTMRLGSKLMVRYRTYPGLEPVITVYDPRNKLKISQSPMKEVAGSSGIYEHEVFLANGWTVGDYTIVCSESSKGTMDALIISAIRTDLEDISGQVSSILGTTTSLANLKDVADTLNSQFSIIESALGKISTDLVNKVKEVASSATDIESVYGQLVKIGKELKTLGASQDVNLSKLLEVSKEKSQDMKYLKNKTQQLKAAMELNNKMVENMAHKPVTQTWFEYK